MGIRKKVDYAFPHEKFHVTVWAEMLCGFVHLMCLLGELDNDKQTHQCTEGDLNNTYNIGENGGTVLLHAKRKVKHLSGTRCTFGRAAHVLLWSVHDMMLCFTYLWAHSER